jgi:ankyrin repeat protein
MVHDKASLALLNGCDQAECLNFRGKHIMNRLQRLVLAAAVAACAAVPLAAQPSGASEARTFLKAVRERDGTQVQAIVSNPSSGAVNARETSTGEGALHILVQRRDLDWLGYLLGRGARPDLQDNEGRTALGLAAQIGWLEGAQQLLARGAKVDLPNNRGETALILAVQARHLSENERLAVIRLLLAQGADPNRQDSFAGYSALDYARQDRRSPAIVEALQQPRGRASAVVGPNP